MIFHSVKSLFISYTLILIAVIAIPLTYAGYVLMDDIIYRSGTENLQDKLESLILPISQRYERLQRIGLEDSKNHLIEIHSKGLKQFETYRYRETGTILVVSKKGEFVVSKDFSKQGSVNDLAILEDLKKADKGVIEYLANDVEKLAVYRFYPPWDEYIALSIEKSELFKARNTFLKIILIVLVTTLALALVSLLSLLKKVINPVVDLAGWAEQISQGNFEKQGQGNFWGEFSSVQHAFDSMRINIKEKVDKIEQQLAIIQSKETNLTNLLLDLEQSEEQVRILLESTAEAIYGIDLNGICTFANPACVRLLGYENTEQLVGKNMYHLVHRLPPEFTLSSDKDTKLTSVLYTGQGIHLDSEILWRADDSSFSSEYWSYPIIKNKQISGAVITFLDITERKQAEEELHKLAWAVEQSTASVLITNLNQEIEYVNEAFLNNTGYVREEVIGKNPRSMYSEKSSTEAYANIDDALSNGQGWQGELLSRRKNGDEYIEYAKITPISQPDGRISHYVEVKDDITEKQRLLDELDEYRYHLEKKVVDRTRELQDSLKRLTRTQNQLIESEKMASLGRLVAGVAHELNTPIGICVTAVSFLRTEIEVLKSDFIEGMVTKTQFSDYIDKAVQSTNIIDNNLKQASTQIKNFKMVAVDISSEMSRMFDVREYLNQIKGSLHPELRRTSHQLSIDCPPKLEVQSYPGMLSQIVTNLVMNSLLHAFEHKPEGKMLIEARLEKDSLLIIYSDDGAGMDKDIVDKIFEPFFTTKPGSQGGSGLGMHIVYNMITQTLGGKVKCESQPGKGTIFTISFPINLQHRLRVV